jgi:hypothetical protein
MHLFWSNRVLGLGPIRIMNLVSFAAYTCLVEPKDQLELFPSYCKEIELYEQSF